MLDSIDWTNLLAGAAIGAVIGFLIASLFHSIAKRDSDRNHRELVERLERLELQGKVKLEKDRRGNIVGIEPVVIQAKTARMTIKGHPATIRLDPQDE